MSWVSSIAARERFLKPFERVLRSEQPADNLLRGLMLAAITAYRVDRVEVFRPMVSQLRDDMSMLLGLDRPFAPSVIARLVSAAVILESLEDDPPEIASLLKDVQARNPVSRLMKKLASHPTSPQRKTGHQRGLPTSRQGFLNRLGRVPANVALEIAHCPGHPFYGSSGAPFVLLLAHQSRNQLAADCDPPRMEDLVAFGRRWDDRSRIVGWCPGDAEQVSPPSCILVNEHDNPTAYHWIGFVGDQPELDERVESACRAAADLSFADLEISQSAAKESVEAGREALAGGLVRHVIVQDTKLSELQEDEVAELGSRAGIEVTLEDVLEV